MGVLRRGEAVMDAGKVCVRNCDARMAVSLI